MPNAASGDQAKIEWRPFPGDTRYEVHCFGVVRNVRTRRELKPWLAGIGYWYVQLGAGGIKTSIHRLVARTFIGAQPTPVHEVAHFDGNRLNNTVGNLRWATHAENVADAMRHGTAHIPHAIGQDHPRATLTSDQVLEIRRRLSKQRGEQILLAREFGVSRYVIQDIIRGKSWRHLS